MEESMQKGLDYLLNKYSARDDAVLTSKNTVTIGNGEYPLLPWEFERRIVELAAIYKSGRIGTACTYRISHTSNVGADLFEMLRREIGILVFTLNSSVKEVFAIQGERCLNAIVECECGTVATIELAATLPAGEEPIDKHEMIANIGVACDRVVDTQIPQHSIYVYGEKSEKFKDTDAELFGYTELEINTIRAAFALACSEERRDAAVSRARELDAAVAAAKRSIDTLENVRVGE